MIERSGELRQSFGGTRHSVDRLSSEPVPSREWFLALKMLRL